MEYGKEIKVDGTVISNLFAKEYEHPMDAACLSALKLNKGFDALTKLIMEYSLDRIMSIMHTGSYVKVTEKNIPYIYDCVKKGCEILGIEKMPTIYLEQDPYINAYTTSVKDPILVLTSGAIKSLNHEELMYIIGHELGHIKSEHVQYHMMGSYIPILGSLVDIPYVGNILTTGLSVAYGEWKRSAEFTSDRAGLLVCQDLKSAITAMIKMGGYPEDFYDSIDVDSFMEQAQEFKGMDHNVYNKVAKLYINLQNSHPWMVYRARELMLWVQHDEYSKIMHRSSSWFKQEVNDLETNSIKLRSELERKKSLLTAKEEKVERTRYQADQSKERTILVTGLKQAAAKAQEALDEAQAQAAESELARLKKEIEDLTEQLEKAEKTISDIKEVMVDLTDEEMKDYTVSVLGDLKTIEE